MKYSDMDITKYFPFPKQLPRIRLKQDINSITNSISNNITNYKFSLLRTTQRNNENAKSFLKLKKDFDNHRQKCKLIKKKNIYNLEFPKKIYISNNSISEQNNENNKSILKSSNSRKIFDKKKEIELNNNITKYNNEKNENYIIQKKEKIRNPFISHKIRNELSSLIYSSPKNREAFLNYLIKPDKSKNNRNSNSSNNRCKELGELRDYNSMTLTNGRKIEDSIDSYNNYINNGINTSSFIRNKKPINILKNKDLIREENDEDKIIFQDSTVINYFDLGNFLNKNLFNKSDIKEQNENNTNKLSKNDSNISGSEFFCWNNNILKNILPNSINTLIISSHNSNNNSLIIDNSNNNNINSNESQNNINNPLLKNSFNYNSYRFTIKDNNKFSSEKRHLDSNSDNFEDELENNKYNKFTRNLKYNKLSKKSRISLIKNNSNLGGKIKNLYFFCCDDVLLKKKKTLSTFKYW